MPWMESSRMSQRREFVALAQQEAIPFAELCRRFGVSRKTGYKWVGREDLTDRSRRPRTSPNQTAGELAKRVIEVRQRHPAWGGRKIARWLSDRNVVDVPHPSTISHILRREGLLGAAKPGQGVAYKRFEHAAPNALWQMDFKGHFAMERQRCHPLTALDDHSRYAIVLSALADEARPGVQHSLERAFRSYGLPARINMDNGQPWGCPSADHGVSALTVWFIRLGIGVSFSAPAHPQTNGKDERFHRTLKAEVLAGRDFRGLDQAQAAFDQWRDVYNYERPHESLGMAVPASRYQPSPRPFPDVLPPIEYAPGDHVRRVNANGGVSFEKRSWRVSKALVGLPVAFRPTGSEGTSYEVYFCHRRLTKIDLSEAADV